MAYCEIYFLLSALSYPALAAYNAGAALLRAMGNSKASMFTSLLMNMTNVIGNAILIYGFKMEVAGAATASLLSRILGAVIMLRMMLNTHAPIHIKRITHPEFDFSMIRLIFRQGIPTVWKTVCSRSASCWWRALWPSSAKASSLPTPSVIP